MITQIEDDIKVRQEQTLKYNVENGDESNKLEINLYLSPDVNK